MAQNSVTVAESLVAIANLYFWDSVWRTEKHPLGSLIDVDKQFHFILQYHVVYAFEEGGEGGR